MDYHSKNHATFLMVYPIIFVGTYRKPLLEKRDDVVKALFFAISFSSRFESDEMEVERDPMHCLSKSEPSISPLSMVRRLKQESTHSLWLRYESILKLHFWKERTFWSDEYFCCSIGNASQDVIRRYSETQG